MWSKLHVRIITVKVSSPSRCTPTHRTYLTHFMKFSLSVLSLSLLAGALASNVLDLDPSNFDSVIGQGKPVLVELYAALSLHFNTVQLLMSRLVLRLGGMSLSVCCEAALVTFDFQSAVTARYEFRRALCT